MVFVGYLYNASKMAGVGMGNTLLNMTGLSLACGLNGALETLVSQGYGAGDLKMCGTYLNRSRAVLLIFFIPVTIFLMKCESILVFIGQDEGVSKYSGKYIIAHLPGIIFLALFDG